MALVGVELAVMWLGKTHNAVIPTSGDTAQ